VSHYSLAITTIAETLRLGGRFMLLRNVLRKIFLCIALGGHPVLGIGMSQQKIEELLHAMHQTRVEMTVSDDEKASDPDR
jgi:hypothetical protein